MKHTKGKWQARTNNEGDHVIYSDNEGVKNLVAKGYFILHGNKRNIIEGEAKANAKLIAAAPELLEFAQAFSSQLANGIIDILKAKEGHNKEVADMVRLNISAIKKATS